MSGCLASVPNRKSHHNYKVQDDEEEAKRNDSEVSFSEVREHAQEGEEKLDLVEEVSEIPLEVEVQIVCENLKVRESDYQFCLLD